MGTVYFMRISYSGYDLKRGLDCFWWQFLEKSFWYKKNVLITVEHKWPASVSAKVNREISNNKHLSQPRQSKLTSLRKFNSNATSEKDIFTSIQYVSSDV